MVSTRAMAIGLILVGAVSVRAQSVSGSSYAFLVACSEYERTELKPLPYTINDIEEFRKVLQDAGFDPDHIKMLHDKQTDRRYLSEKAKIVKELNLLIDGMQERDTLIVALSGHGVHFKGDPTGYFCPVDGKLNDKSTLLPMEGKGGLFEAMRNCKAKRKLLFVNACRNDPASDVAQATRKIDLDDADNDRIPEGVAALYSCRAGEKSYYDPDRKMGLFFIHLCKAMRGRYHPTEDRIALEQLFETVKVRTKNDADKTFAQPQVPVVRREYQGEWTIDLRQNRSRRALDLARELMNRKRFDDAIVALDDALKMDPDLAIAYSRRGRALAMKGDFTKALADHEISLKMDPTDARNFGNRGRTHLDRLEYDKAIADFDQAIRLNPKDASQHFERGKAYLAKAELDRAITDYTTAIDLDPTKTAVWIDRGRAWSRKREYQKAINDYTKALEVNPKAATAYNNRGVVYRNMKEYDKAMADFEAALRLVPKYGLAFCNRGALYRVLQQPDKALADLDKGLEIEPKHAFAWVERAEIKQWTKKDFDAAISDYTQAIVLDPKLPAAYLGRGMAFSQKKENDKALADLNRAIDLDPKLAHAWIERGVFLNNVKSDYDKAIADFNKAIDLNPTSAIAFANRGNTWRNKSDLTRALADLNKAIELNPRYAYAYQRRAQVYDSQGQKALADADRKKAAELK